MSPENTKMACNAPIKAKQTSRLKYRLEKLTLFYFAELI